MVHVGSIPTPPQKKPNKEMQKKIDFAITLIRKAAEIAEANGSELEVCYSGGKDSDVILHLAQRAGVKFDAIYKNTTIDPPGTIAHALKKGVRMVRPQETFAQLVRQKGMPSRFRRHCCSFNVECAMLVIIEWMALYAVVHDVLLHVLVCPLQDGEILLCLLFGRILPAPLWFLVHRSTLATFCPSHAHNGVAVYLVFL